ncbi:Serine/threonine protein kinase [Methylophaga frappieri]|uniref:Serine/threonine protein kinase n=1 Tax=Methylophaga frappieri (strain ATCC BAA-2434 / DSM 25690 / JAM7) TaxID=754477 RepID=I1YH25_METFJ|nr:bifunctional protein-serine/threonine kinase/phosphatase [Methylophaga frappieri]AFJ02218.1 Serine/threonine protein kinase [Methylophaga frappieri]
MVALAVRYGQQSLAGAKAENQDALGCLVPDNPVMLESKGIVCALADGISSSERARQASHAAITGFVEDYFSTPDSWSVKQSGGKVLTAINVWLCGQGQHFRDSSRGWATTFSGLILKSSTAHLFHVGDARIYLLRGQSLEQLTADHRIRISDERAYLGRALGVDYALDIDYKSLPIEAGDCFVLLTDGVHEWLSDAELKHLLSEKADLQELAEHICQQALARGSDDNLSCQLVEVTQVPQPDADEAFARLTALPFPPELYEGVILDGYRVIKTLHASSTSQLYLAIDTDNGNKVVLKTPSVNFEDDPAYLERFQLEEWIGRRIDHAHVVRVIEQQRPRRFLYYVLEYVEGRTLEQWLDDEGSLSLQTVRQILPQIISGLRAFHRLDMLHQDIKPANILMTDDGVLKIIDFGSTKIAGIADIVSPVERQALLGTRHYSAPEYLRGEPGSPQSDQFSLGILVYQLLSNRLPFGEAYAKIRHPQQLNRLQYQSLSEYQGDIPHWVDKAIRRTVAMNPERRYEALSEFEADIKKPNPSYLHEERPPLLERNPLAFWRTFSLLLVLSNLLLLYLWLTVASATSVALDAEQVEMFDNWFVEHRHALASEVGQMTSTAASSGLVKGMPINLSCSQLQMRQPMSLTNAGV